MLADFAGPPGWHGLAEFVGWWTVCIAATVACDKLFAQYRTGQPRRARLLLPSLLIAGGLLALAFAEAQPATPLSVKHLYTTTLQVIGVAGALALVAVIGWTALSSRKA